MKTLAGLHSFFPWMSSFSPDSAHDEFAALFADSESWQRSTQSLQRIANRVLKDAAAAEDVVQGAWVEALQVRREGKGTGWLRSLVRSRSIDALRRRDREARMLDADAAREEAPSNDPLGSMLEVQREVLAAVNSLKEPYRTAVYLRYFQGLGPRAMARQLRIPEGTVKTRLTRAHVQLRALLGSKFQGGDGHWAPALVGFASAPLLPLGSPLGLPPALLLMKKVAFALCSVLVLVTGWLVLRSDGTGPLSVLATPSPAEGRSDLQPTGADGDGASIVLGQDRQRLAHSAASLDAGPDSDPTEAFGALHVRIQRANGEPAEGVRAIVTTGLDWPFLYHRLRSATDAAGLAVFSRLPAGTVELHSDRSPQAEVTEVQILAGQVAQAHLQLPEGRRLVGRVSDPSGTPLAGAGIWLVAGSGGWTGNGLVATTDGSGSYEIQDVPKGRSVGALAAGYQASELVDLDLEDAEASSLTIDMVLVPGGAELWGTVRGSGGQPVAGALVAVGKDALVGNRRSDGSFEERWGSFTARTGSDGTFALVGLPQGTHAIQVSSQDHALWTDSVQLHGGDRREVSIDLTAGVVVRGVVTDPMEQPVVGALVLAHSEPLGERYLQGGQVDYGGTFACPTTTTDGAGAYELRAVAPGRSWLYAVEPKADPDSRTAVLRYAKENRSLALGAEHSWNPVLQDGAVIEGRAMYLDRSPITGVYVILEGQSSKEERVFRSKDGSFRFLNLGDGPYSVRVQVRERPAGAIAPRLDGIVPGGPPVEVVASFSVEPRVQPIAVRVRLVDEHKGTGASRSVVIESAKSFAWTRGHSGGDQWSFELEHPGVYRAVGLLGERVVCTGEDFEVFGGEQLELPDLVRQPGGTLLLRFESPGGFVPRGLRAFLRRRPSKGAEAFDWGVDTELKIEHLEPGPGVISLLGKNVRQLELSFHVRSGQETVLEVPLVPAVPVPYRIEWTEAEAGGTMSIRFTERTTGDIADEFFIEDLTVYNSPIQWSAFLPLGSYTFEVQRNGSLHQREEFEVTSLDQELVPTLGFD